MARYDAYTAPPGPTQRTVSYHTIPSNLQVAGKNPELHSLRVHRNCQQSLKATAPIPIPMGHISHLFHTYLEWKLELINAL